MAIQTMASAHGFEESSMIALLTHGNTLAVQELVETPEKITAAIAVFGRLNLADPAMIRVLLANGGRPAVRALLETLEKITAVMTVFSENLADPGMIIVLLTHGGRPVIQAFLQATRQLATAMQTMASANGFEELSMIALLAHGNTLAVQELVETPE